LKIPGSYPGLKTGLFCLISTYDQRRWWLTQIRDATAEWLVNVQLPKEYYKEYLEATEPMYIKPREMRIVNRSGPPFVFYKRWNQEKN